MRLLNLLTATAVSATLALPAMGQSEGGNIFDAVMAETGQSTPNISTNELLDILDAGQSIVVDVRTWPEYAMDHIPGSKNVYGKAGTNREAFTADWHAISALAGDDKSAEIVLYCNGPYCGKSKRVAHDLYEQGFTNVRRYQLGIPVWRALGEPCQTEADAIALVLAKDKTAVLIDTRSPEQFHQHRMPQSVNIPAAKVTADNKGGQEVKDAKEDGRLPMEDHNTRIIVIGNHADDARKVAHAVQLNAFQNVAYFNGAAQDLATQLKSADAGKMMGFSTADDAKAALDRELANDPVMATDADEFDDDGSVDISIGEKAAKPQAQPQAAHGLKATDQALANDPVMKTDAQDFDDDGSVDVRVDKEGDPNPAPQQTPQQVEQTNMDEFNR